MKTPALKTAAMIGAFEQLRRSRVRSITTINVIRQVTGYYLSNTGVQVSESWNASVGRALRKNVQLLRIAPSARPVKAKDDESRLTTTRVWTLIYPRWESIGGLSSLRQPRLGRCTVCFPGA